MHAVASIQGTAAQVTRWCEYRPFRIAALLTTVLLMSAADLYLTLLYLTTIGFAEANPFARFVMEMGSPGLLAGWKIASLVPITLVAWKLRTRRLGEVAAWVSVLVMTVVTLHWYEYAAQTELLTMGVTAFDTGLDHRWVAMTRD